MTIYSPLEQDRTQALSIHTEGIADFVWLYRSQGLLAVPMDIGRSKSLAILPYSVDPCGGSSPEWSDREPAVLRVPIPADDGGLRGLLYSMTLRRSFGRLQGRLTDTNHSGGTCVNKSCAVGIASVVVEADVISSIVEPNAFKSGKQYQTERRAFL